MTALLLGTLLALGALSFVLYPLFTSSPPVASPTPDRQNGDGETDRNPALDALREIEFDRETGKLSDADYAALKETYTHRAVTAMRGGGGPVCITCGPRPESDARYCSNCGARLAA
ncbi:MAG TPA: hypothetical protein VES88_15800 [Gemmatimonadaceae bacterium]|nr:hypothetical protein [Gemmatimonadaceae bacterium]